MTLPKLYTNYNTKNFKSLSDYTGAYILTC